MPLIFPNNPTLGQLYQSGSSGTFVYNGEAWDSQNTNVALMITASFAATASFVATASFATVSDQTKVWFISATSNQSYTMPGGYVADPCRYNILSTTVNVSSSWFDTAAYRFTPLKAGYWQITATYDIYRGAAIEAGLAIQRNGFTVATVGGIGTINATVSRVVYLNGFSDYVSVINTGGGANARTQASDRTFFEATWLGA